MTRFVWTDEAVAELRRQMNYERTYAEIGAMFGVSDNAIRQKVCKLGWSGKGRVGTMNAKRCAGKKMNPAVRAKIAAAQKARWSDPAHRDRMVRIITANNQAPDRCRKVRAAIAVRRGFVVPDELRDEYRHLLNIKDLTAREAGQVLGLIPPSTTASKGA